MSFWTDAAVLGSAGIPSVLFGPGGAGLHSVEEYVEVQDVLRCRDTLAALARGWCVGEVGSAEPRPCSGGLAQDEPRAAPARDGARRLRSADAVRGR